MNPRRLYGPFQGRKSGRRERQGEGSCVRKRAGGGKDTHGYADVFGSAFAHDPMAAALKPF